MATTHEDGSPTSPWAPPTATASTAWGSRITKAGTGYTGTIRYVYAEDGKLLGEYDNTGTIIAEHVYLNDTPVAVLKAAGAYLVQADHLNTPRAILGASNSLVWKWDSDAFGTTAANENPSALGAFNYNLRFPGQYYDKETANHYNYFRDNYNPKIGRYMQSDPIGLRAGVNTYVYANGNPVNAIDQFGLETTIIVNTNGIGHVGVITGSGKDRTLYDPAGSYPNPNRGSGDALSGPDANLSKYLDFRRQDGPKVSMYTFNTSSSDEATIIQNIDNVGGCSTLLCSTCVGNTLRGVGPFKNLGSTLTPGGMATELQRLLRK